MMADGISAIAPAIVGTAVLREPTTTIVLHGALAKRYGRRHQLGVKTAPQAAYALCAMIPGFREDFQDGWYRVVRGRVADGLVLSEAELHLQAAPGGEIHFLPAARGGKQSGGTMKAVLGAVILVAAVAGAAFTGGGSLALGSAAFSAGGLSVSYGAIAFFGATMLLSGVSSLLSSTSNKLNTMVDAKTSYSLTGNTNSTAEGTPIPVVYGRTRVGSVVGSFGYYAEDYDGSQGISPEPTPNDDITGGSGAIGAGGGGKGGSSGGASEAPNTLRSRAVVRLIDILSEGPIGGLVDGAKSIFFNNTPLMAADGSYNFQGVSWDVRTGYPSQDVVPGYPASEQTLGVNVEVQNAGAGPITRTFTSPNATAARVTVRIPALAHQNPTNGNLEAFPRLAYTIAVAPSGSGAFQAVVNEEFVNQKCTSPYERSYRIALPSTVQSWDIRITKTTADAASANDQCSVIWESVTLVTEQALMHPNVAYVALTIDAAAFGSQIPTRQYEIDGVLCAIPYNYDPPSGTYATTGGGTAFGTWDGATFKAQTTSNPAWCLYDMLTNRRYGLGLDTGTAVANTRFDLYTIGQYCDGTVPSGYTDGSGNMIQERRYTLNAALTQQVDAYRLIQSMVSAFRGMSYWGAGRVVVTADMPTAPSYVLNPSNVIDGEFTYEGSPLKSRHTVARVSWLDPANSYMEAIEVVEDFDAVVSQGQVPVDIIAFGCTSRGLARRWGKWMLDTEKHQTELLSCGVGLEELRSRPGDVVRVADPAYAGVRMGGRVRSDFTDTATVHLDQYVPTNSNNAYFISITMPDGTVADRVSVSYFTINDSTSVVHLNAALPQVPLANATWVLSSTGPSGSLPVETRQFRVLAMAEPHRGQYQLSGLIHDPNKYARVELGIEFDPTPFSTLNGLLVSPLPAPTNVVARDFLVGVGTTTTIRVSVSWSPVTDVRVVGYQVHADGPEPRDASADGGTLDMDGLTVGTYTFRVRSVGRDGRVSIWSDSPQINVDGQADPPDAPLALTAQGGALQVKLSWTGSRARDLRHYEIWRAPAAANGQHPFPFSGYNPVGSPSSNNASLIVAIAATGYTDSGDVLAPDTAWAYWVRAINTTGGASAFAGPVKALTTLYLTDNLADGIKNTAPIAQALLGSAPRALKDLSTPGQFDGQLALNASDQKLYRWVSSANNGNGAWQLFIPLIPDALGQIADASIAAVSATKIAGAFTPEQNKAVVDAIANGQITDRMIASLAGSKVSGQLSSNATMQAGQIYDVDPVTGNVVVGVNTTKLLGQIGTTQITDGAITTQKIGANQVTANNITAGAITGNKLAIAGAGNVIGNPTCPASAWGWPITYTTKSGVQVGSVTGDGLIGNSWALAGEGSGVVCLQNGTLGTSDGFQVSWDPDTTNGVACSPGDWWEAQVYFGAHRCYGVIQLEFFDGNGNFVGGQTSPRVAGPVGGRSLSNYGFTWVKAQAPSTATNVRMTLKALNDNASDISAGTPGSNPNLFWTHALLALSTSLPIAQGAQPQPYTIGGVTQVVGGQIKTGAVTARQISAGAIDATKLTVGSVSNVITNSCCTVSSSGWASTASVSAVPVYSAFLLNGFGTGLVVAGSIAPGQAFETYWAPNGDPFKPDGSHGVPWSAAIACNPGEVWEAQAQFITSLCSVNLHVLFLAQGTDGAWYLASYGTTGPNAWGTPADGKTLDQYHQLSTRGTVPGPGTYGGVYCPHGATLVTLMFRMGNDGASQAQWGSGTQNNARIWFTRAALGIAQTVAAPMAWAPGGATQIDGGQVKANSIVAGTLAAGAVTASNIQAGSIGVDKLAAGSITADKLAIGSAANLIWNSDPDQGLDGWTYYPINLGSPPAYMGTAAALNANFALKGSGSAFCQYADNNNRVYSNQGFIFDWNPAGLAGTSGQGYGLATANGTTWGAALSIISGNYAQVFLQLLFYDFQMNLKGAVGAPVVVNTNPPNGLVLDQYTRAEVIGVTPPGASFVVMRIYIVGTDSGSVAPFCAWTHAQLCQLPTGSTKVGPYTPGGVTTISGGMIKTGSLLANRITAGTITGDQIAGNSVDANKLRANSITAGQIQAGAIGADQIAANQIRSSHLASDFVLANSAQIGTAVIDYAQIKNLAVGTSKIAQRAVSYAGYQMSPGGNSTSDTYATVYNLGDYTQDGNGVLIVWRISCLRSPQQSAASGGEGGSG